MSLVRRLQASTSVGPNPNTSFIRDAFFSARSQAGKTVTVDRAMQFDAVWACIRLKAYMAGQMPIRVYERVGDEETRPAPGERVNKVLRKPNREMVRFNTWGLVNTHLNSWGNAYLGKSFDVRGQVSEIWPIRPDLVRVARHDGVKVFYVRDQDTGLENPQPFTGGEIIHVMGFSLDGLVGLSPIGQAREAIGAGLAMDHFSNVFYRNSAVPPLVLASETPVDEAGRKRIRREWEKVSRGFRNAWRTVILEQGVKPMPLTMSLKDTQFIEGAEHGLQKICRWFGVWPSMVGVPTGGSMEYSTVEGEALRFLMFTMNPELSLVEQTIEGDEDLFPVRPGDIESRFYPEFVRGKILQVDAHTEARVFAIATGNRAYMRPSEVRAIKNLPPDPDLDDPELNPSRAAAPAAGGDRSPR